MDVVNIPLANSTYIESFGCDQRSYSGCATCDYGSDYITEIDMETTNRVVSIRQNQMYEYAFKASDCISIFGSGVNHMTEEEFIQYFCTKLVEICKKGYGEPGTFRFYIDGEEFFNPEEFVFHFKGNLEVDGLI